ncbi:uncharacterized protein LOC100574816 isoform X1 [Acyrthosiphon pisum]|uniref:Uncharacterized protein n=2 Tax=Acyrthosiphon pisum TaxID=7029 RepID=A0A8R1W9Q7_ACYPI|nr:uncharacterized protein LOC100574816 isoform X1 [Acyrthosiphon pisum]WEX73763.1 pigment dispersing factor [Acyrthosiphon pisum]|eukprot:XP_003244595.1 PREDICTED: uncharacterized protein LOC100574816 isoform X1 [Acyrthosiphon pisum]
MKLLGHIHHLLLICAYLTYLIIMTNGYPLRTTYCSLYVPDDNSVIEEQNAPIATKPVLFFGKRHVEDDSSNDLIKPSESNIILKKKNSEIISALMGLRRAMSNKYDARHIHN